MEKEREHKDELNAVVLSYLKKMGFRQTEQLFREEAHVSGLEGVAFELRNEQDSSIANYLLLHGASDAIPFVPSYEQSYDRLRKWCFESLDMYREELVQVLFPIFVHCFLDLVFKGHVNEAHRFMETSREDHVVLYGDDVARLSAITEPSQLRENPLALAFRNNKYNLAMSAYSFQLLMNFLQDSAATTSGGSILLLKIVNQFLNIRVLVNKPGMATASYSGFPTGIVGLSLPATNTINRERIQWGVTPVSDDIEKIVSQRLRSDPSSARQAEQLHSTLSQMKRSYSDSSSQAPERNRIALKNSDTQVLSAELDRLKELSKRALLSSTAQPSICAYTVHNTYGGVTSIDFSPDATLLATGSRDSYIDVWSLTGTPLRAIRPSTELAAMDFSDIDSLEPLRETEGSQTKRLVGHSGPVYASRFMSPNGRHLIVSASQDGTSLLWSLDTFSPVACYRGHQLPIWDIDVPPISAGPFFVTGSADRTARLWATELVQPVRIFAGHLADVDVVKYHPNGNYIATGSSDKTCRLWDVQTGTSVRLFSGHNRAVTALAISPNGRILASADRLGTIKLWDFAEGRIIRTVHPAHLKNPYASASSKSATVFSLDFCQDGRMLASAGADNTVRLWDVQRLLTITGPTASTPSGVDETGLLSAFPTKQTPIFQTRFTYRNVLVVAGPYLPDDTE